MRLCRCKTCVSIRPLNEHLLQRPHPRLIILPQYWFLQQFFWSSVMHVVWWVIVLRQKANTSPRHCFGRTLIMLLQRKGTGLDWSLPPRFRQHQKWPILSFGSGINRQMIYTHKKKPRTKIKAISRGTHVARIEIGREDVSKWSEAKELSFCLSLIWNNIIKAKTCYSRKKRKKKAEKKNKLHFMHGIVL